jgi:hypothetical protein
VNIGLREAEDGFQRFVVDGRPGFEACVVADAAADAAQRLDVYYQAYRLRLVEALGNDYPELKRFVGDADFERLARAYIERVPSTHRSVRWVGKAFARFLRSPECPATEPVLADLAAFEWTRGEVFDAPDAPRIDVEDIARIAPEHWPSMRLTLQPALRRLSLKWNAPAICSAQSSGSQTPAPEKRLTEWLLWRRDLEIHWRSLEGAEAGALAAAGSSATFAELCEGLLHRFGVDQVALQAAGLLKRWAADGLVTRLSVQAERSVDAGT